MYNPNAKLGLIETQPTYNDHIEAERATNLIKVNNTIFLTLRQVIATGNRQEAVCVPLYKLYTWSGLAKPLDNCK